MQTTTYKLLKNCSSDQFCSHKGGGCIIYEDPPDRHCNDCEHQWKTTDNYNFNMDYNEVSDEENKVCKHCQESPMYCKCWEDLIDEKDRE